MGGICLVLVEKPWTCILTSKSSILAAYSVVQLITIYLSPSVITFRVVPI
jgi:hypothetical protein